MTLPIMKFIWEEVKGTKMTFPSHPTPIIITEGLGVQVEEKKLLGQGEGSEGGH